MQSPLRILHLEDDARDAELLQAMLEAEGIVSHVTRVDSRADFLASLEEGGFDLILADYALPSFDGLSALIMVLEKCPDVPFIFVSGILGEEVAIEALKIGATDYVLKERLSRIVPAVQRALREAQERVERRRAEEALGESRARLASVIASAMDAIITVDADQRIILFNSSAEQMFGYRAAGAIGQTLDRFIPERFRQAHREHVPAFGRTQVTKRRMGALGTVYGLRANGDEFPVEASISQIEVGGQKLYTVILRDITDRKRAEEELRESEERFRNMADTAPVMIWVSGADKLCTYFNQQWLDFTGRTLGDELGAGWAEGVHPEDYERCLRTYNEAFDRRETFRMEYRLRRSDGQFRWIYDTGVPRFSSGKEFMGFIGSCVDITDRKQAEEELRHAQAAQFEISLETRVRERTRIARELHDTLLQNFQVLLLRFQSVLKVLPERPLEARQRLESAIDQAAQAITDARDAIQGLRSLVAETGGLARAITAVGEELTANRTDSNPPAIDVEVEGGPRNLNPVVCDEVYRIAGEAMRNAFRHAQARRITVEIRYGEGQFRLRVRDDGKGLDEETVRRAASAEHFGLPGMRERAENVGGRLEVRSRLDSGTEVDLSIPGNIAYGESARRSWLSKVSSGNSRDNGSTET